MVWNDSLAFCQEKYRSGEKKPTNSQLQKQFITQSKNTEDREWLSEVSAIPLQQSLNDLNQAYQNFFSSTKGKRKGRHILPPDCFVPRNAPRFKSKKSKQTARFTCMRVENWSTQSLFSQDRKAENSMVKKVTCSSIISNSNQRCRGEWPFAPT
ncbi:hypothetical protein [Dapis sp. BLCC M229]|uniref:hypothetical protein n=1 Tax=Dapis sp. BLCC M229 TaxID=3400188 RepID=UPI003CEF2D8D